jgi:hypothetical protein
MDEGGRSRREHAIESNAGSGCRIQLPGMAGFNTSLYSRQLLLHCSTSCIHEVVSPASVQSWISAQICLEQICIDPKGARQESLA